MMRYWKYWEITRLHAVAIMTSIAKKQLRYSGASSALRIWFPEMLVKFVAMVIIAIAEPVAEEGDGECDHDGAPGADGG
jgi:hypothetical protein